MCRALVVSRNRNGGGMFIKINTRSDRRLVKAVQELMPEEFAAQHLMATATIIYIDHKNPVALLEACLDRVLPGWRQNTSAHVYRQGSALSKELMLLRVWSLCLEQNSELVPFAAASEVESAPVQDSAIAERATLATLYKVPAGWLATVPLATEPRYFPAEASPPVETHVRRAERVLTDPVRCGRCSDQVEFNKRGSHANIHGLHVADIEWSPVTRFRRA